MQDVGIRIGATLLVFAVVGIIVVFSLERFFIYRRRKHEKENQSFLDVISPR
jgi:hypothetical protein